MEQPVSDDRFSMTEPMEMEPNRFFFQFSTSDQYLYEFLESIICIRSIAIAADGTSALVEIDNEFDPDEAWHWVRTELEEEINTVHLDNIWVEAIKWIL